MQTLGSLQPLVLLAKLLEAWGITVNAFETTGSTTTGSPDMTAMGDTSGIEIGMLISGVGIPAGTHVVAVTSNTTITMSNSPSLPQTGATFAFAFANTAEIHLATDPMAQTSQPAPSAFTEATFDTYAPLSVAVLVGPYLQPDGSAEVDSADASWVLTADATVTNTITGYWIDYVPPGGGPRVVALWEKFPTPIPMAKDGNAVVFNLPFNYPDPGTATVIGM